MWESRRKGWEPGKGVREPEVKGEGPREKEIGTRREWSRNQERKRQEIGEKGRETTEKGVGPAEKRGREPGEKKVGPSLRVAVPLFCPRGRVQLHIGLFPPALFWSHFLLSWFPPPFFSWINPSLWFLPLSLLLPVGGDQGKRRFLQEPGEKEVGSGKKGGTEEKRV